MNESLQQLKKGVTKLIFLSALANAPQYGYGLRRELCERSNGTFRLSEGALYPLLQSLERRRLVTVRRTKVAGRERRYYELTPRGERELAALRREWQSLVGAVAAIVRPAPKKR